MNILIKTTIIIIIILIIRIIIILSDLKSERFSWLSLLPYPCYPSLAKIDTNNRSTQ